MSANPSDINMLNRGNRLRELVKFAAPNVAMMVVLSLYTIADGIFVSRYLGSIALSGMNMILPSFNLIFAVALMLAIGGSAVCARLIGEGEKIKSHSTFSMLILILLIIGMVTSFVGASFHENIISLLGVTEKQQPYSLAYGYYCALFAPAFILQAAFQVFFVTAGKPSIGLILTISGGVMNIVLDYIFLDTFAMGIEGAAIASGVGASIPMLGGFIFFAISKTSNLHFVFPKLKIMEFIRICVNGSSEMVAHLSAGVTTFLFNIMCLRFYGEAGVAAISIILYLQFLFSSFFFGYAEGVAPITSYHYGAQNTYLLKKTFKNNLIIIAIMSVSVCLLSILSIDNILAVFALSGDDAYTRHIAREGFFLYVPAFLLMAFNMFASAHFTALGNGLISGLLSFTRAFVCLAGCILLLPEFIGAKGIWIAVPIAEGLGLCLAYYFIRRYRAVYSY